MRRLIRTALWLGLLAGVLWLARSALKAWIEGPEVTPSSGGWPNSAGVRATTPDRAASPAPSAPGAAPAGPARAGAATTGAGTSTGAAASAGEAASTGTVGDEPAPAKKSSGTRKRASKRPPDSGKWVLPNGSDEILQSHPVKAKLGSRVYRVPGMPMYDRTVADRCYATVEEAEADGFNRAAR